MAVRVVDNTLPQPFPGEAAPYALIVVLEAKPGRGDDLGALLESVIDQTRAEPGCVVYTLNRERAHRDRFYFYESYRDIGAFQAHLDAPYIKELLAKLPPYLAKDNEMVFLTETHSPERRRTRRRVA